MYTRNRSRTFYQTNAGSRIIHDMWTLLSTFALADPGAIDTIRARWTSVQARIERNDAAVLSVDWNAEDLSWPAVGTYDQRLRAWYVKREESPYPDLLVKIVAERRNAARTERHTYLYDDAGKLVFVLAENPEHPTVRAYWSDKLLRVQLDDAIHDAPVKQHAALAASLAQEGAQVFQVAKALLGAPVSLSSLENAAQEL